MHHCHVALKPCEMDVVHRAVKTIAASCVVVAGLPIPPSEADFRPTPGRLRIRLRIPILRGLGHCCALQQTLHPSPQNGRRVPALPISTLSLSSPQLSACARACWRGPGVIDCMRSGMGSVAGTGAGYGEERECVGRTFYGYGVAPCWSWSYADK
jgi:hypothetical protein